MNISGVVVRRSSLLFAALSLLVLGGCEVEIIGVGGGPGGGSGGSTSSVSSNGSSSAKGSSSGSTSATGSSSSGMPPVDPTDAITAVGQCMSKTAFTTSNLAQLYNVPTNGDCTCATCHAAAEANLNGGQFILDPDALVTFAAAQQLPGLLNYVAFNQDLGQVDETHVIEFMGQDHGSCSCQTALGLKVNGVINVNDPAYCHPDYWVPSAMVDQLDFFVQNAIVRSQTLVCTPDNTP